MPYWLSPDIHFHKAVETVLGDQLSQAADLLETAPEGIHSAIHEARRRMKRARALYRLIASAVPDLRKRENTRLASVARSLSAVRDATALMETAAYLSGFANDEHERSATALAAGALEQRRGRIEAECGDLAAEARKAAHSCREAIDAFCAADLPGSPQRTARIVHKGWKKTLRRAEAALEECRNHPQAESYHDLRKATQTYWMQLSLLRQLWPTAMAAKRKEAKALADMLGHEHDLTVLAATLDGEPALVPDTETLSRLLGLIIRQQQLLRKAALDAAEALFRDGPEPEASIVRSLWLRAATA
ncbi:CHAD domain-containing protein [Allorhizobium undicola]|uniref:CHAD domain-containing protein n=1 Tax=Allorhizobium undicola TaxID=78527 RepID=UPI0004810CA4|nr:CHAD domain-containing protein [Allorhizobium undicola]